MKSISTPTGTHRSSPTTSVLTHDFFGKYTNYDSYALHGTAYMTNADPAKGGNGDHYVADTSKVRDIKLADGWTRRLFVGTLESKKNTKDGKNHGVQLSPKFKVGSLPPSTLYDYCIQMCVGVQPEAPKGSVQGRTMVGGRRQVAQRGRGRHR